jgi:hypothetical protein
MEDEPQDLLHPPQPESGVDLPWYPYFMEIVVLMVLIVEVGLVCGEWRVDRTRSVGDDVFLDICSWLGPHVHPSLYFTSNNREALFCHLL